VYIRGYGAAASELTAAMIARGRPHRLQCLDIAWVPFAKLRTKPFSRADLHIIAALRGSKAPEF